MSELEIKVEIWKLRKAVMAVLVNTPPSIMMQEEILKAGEPVVRLSAVDTLLAEAVWAMEFVAGQVAPWGQHGQRAQAFLSSPAVLDYLARVKARMIPNSEDEQTDWAHLDRDDR